MMSQTGHHQHTSDSEDRRNRFLSANSGDSGVTTLRERAASQPPRSLDQGSYAGSPSQQSQIPSNLGGTGASFWSTRHSAAATHGLMHAGLPQSVPTRTSSFSNQQAQFSSAMREPRPFASTFEDDESEVFSDTHDELYIPSSTAMPRGRTSVPDPTRSRSQSLAASRPGPIGSPYHNLGISPSWHESSPSSSFNPTNPRYGEIKPPGSSRYGSLGTLGRPSTHIHSSSPSGGSVGNGYSHRQPMDLSNMSPFVRDVGQILLDDGSAFRELWAGMHPPKDENGGGGSGTTSRRHSVSVVQPRRGNIVGFNAPGADGPDDIISRPFQPSAFGRGGLMLSDDDLASDLNLLSLNPRDRQTAPAQHPPSQPASLPIYVPLSRSPTSSDRVSPYQSINLTIPSASFASHQARGSPSDSGLSVSDSPTRGPYDPVSDSPFAVSGNGTQQRGQPPLTARFVPGQGIQYLPQQTTNANFNNNDIPYNRSRAPSYPGSIPSPVSPTGIRPIKPQQPPFYPQQTQRRPSDASPTPLSELGKGVPLHAVPASWPLYIVEFKAGRTDLFYLTDLSLDVRVGDLVIVEADRGKDLGKVVNDTITLAEVEAFQKQQQARVSFGDGQPMSPGGSVVPSTKKEISPKKIYGKAQPQDTQLLVSKIQDEVKALQLCQSKVRAKKLPMQVIDAEYQWDRRKLTFYFIAEKRIDFRELVRELFRLYKTRIWMASLQGSVGYEQS